MGPQWWFQCSTKVQKLLSLHWMNIKPPTARALFFHVFPGCDLGEIEFVICAISLINATQSSPVFSPPSVHAELLEKIGYWLWYIQPPGKSQSPWCETIRIFLQCQRGSDVKQKKWESKSVQTHKLQIVLQSIHLFQKSGLRNSQVLRS